MLKRSFIIILQLIYKRFFSGKSEIYSCTLNSDRNLINRRNVKADPHDAYRPNRDFLLIVLKSRVVVAAMSVLGFTDKTCLPTKCPLPDDLDKLPNTTKLNYLHKAASLVVDNFVFEVETTDKLFDDILSVQQLQDQLAQRQQTRNADGRFPCSFPGCSFTFKFDGKSKKKHEQTHNHSPEIPDASNESTDCSSAVNPDQRVSNVLTKPSDDIFSYNCALLADGLYFLNFLDSVKEGDGERSMRQYRYMLLYCRADNQGSTKYALECLYQLFLINSILSRRDSERFVWNRGVNTRGGHGNNIPADLEVEHSNKFIKSAIKNLGPNITEKAVKRISKAENGVRNLSEDFDRNLNRVRGCGKRTSSSTDSDLDELIKRAEQVDVFSEQPGRCYEHFKGFERDSFKRLCMSSMYNWINKHKQTVIFGNMAR